MRKLLTGGVALGLAALQLAALPSTVTAQSPSEPLAILVPGGGTYSRPITTDSDLAQQFFDQGLRMAWSFYFPESIASYQEASRLDPDSPMPYFGLAHAAGPNPNSRYAGMPDDPQGTGLAAIREALHRIDNATPREQDMIRALFVLYNKDAHQGRKFFLVHLLHQSPCHQQCCKSLLVHLGGTLPGCRTVFLVNLLPSSHFRNQCQ